MTITSTMNDDIKMWCSVFFGNVKPFVDVHFGESDRRLLDVEIGNLCELPAFFEATCEIKNHLNVFKSDNESLYVF